jgi:hypothetical protein
MYSPQYDAAVSGFFLFSFYATPQYGASSLIIRLRCI